ncbi:MAG: mandelate racemase/muconate lactonizing enzyme family protein [Streptosporangiales bacterium]|nr:mandelate racemase/muconate lactonizing enzyme family protein [Streptosporangiales bacterium]
MTPRQVGRVVRARIRVLRAEAGGGIAMSFAPLTHRTCVLVELESDDGVVGHGESWVNYPAWAHEERVATLRDGVLPLVLGRHASDVRGVQAELAATLDPLGRQWGAPGPIRQALSGVDIALWDLWGRTTGRSIAELAGGRTRDEIAVYASSLGPSDVTRQAAACRDAGHRAVKVKVGFGRENDERALLDARNVLGDVALYADANQAWSLDEAVGLAAMLREHGIVWLEEPVRGDRVTDLERLHQRTGMAIATGENVYGIDAFRTVVDSPGVAVVQPDLTKAGGVTEALEVCALARRTGTVVNPHLYGGAVGYAATLQLAAHAAVVGTVEYDIRDNPLRDPLLRDPPTPRDGAVALPSGPGIGVDLDADAADGRTLSVMTVA